MSSSNCCFLTCLQISQEAGQVVWYSHFFQNFPQFIVIHTVKGFGIVNKASSDQIRNYMNILLNCLSLVTLDQTGECSARLTDTLCAPCEGPFNSMWWGTVRSSSLWFDFGHLFFYILLYSISVCFLIFDAVLHVLLLGKLSPLLDLFCETQKCIVLQLFVCQIFAKWAKIYTDISYNSFSGGVIP